MRFNANFSGFDPEQNSGVASLVYSDGRMSACGTKRTSANRRFISGLGAIADIESSGIVPALPVGTPPNEPLQMTKSACQETRSVEEV
jgi:hypothetical protein